MDFRNSAEGYGQGQIPNAVAGPEHHTSQVPHQKRVFEPLPADECEFQVSEDFEFVETQRDGHETSDIVPPLPFHEQSARLDFSSTTISEQAFTTPAQQHSATQHLRSRILNPEAFNGQVDSEPSTEQGEIWPPIDSQPGQPSPATLAAQNCHQPDLFLTLEEHDWEPPSIITPGQEQYTASNLTLQNQDSSMQLQAVYGYQLFDPDMTSEQNYLGPEQETEWSPFMQDTSSSMDVQATASHPSLEFDMIHESVDNSTEQNTRWNPPQQNVGSINHFYDANGHQPSSLDASRETVHPDQNQHTGREAAQLNVGIGIPSNLMSSYESSEPSQICESALLSQEENVEQSSRSGNDRSGNDRPVTQLYEPSTYQTLDLDISHEPLRSDADETSVISCSTSQDNFFGSASPSTVNACTTWSGIIRTDQLSGLFGRPTIYGQIPLVANSQSTRDFYESLLVNTRGSTLRPLISQHGLDFSQYYPCHGYVKGPKKRVMAIPLRRITNETSEPIPPYWLVKIMGWPETQPIQPVVPQVQRSEDQSDQSSSTTPSMEHPRNVTSEVQVSQDDGICNETFDVFKHRLIRVFKQMMYVSGETVEPSTETTWMIEEIVREQVVEMLKEASALANRRGSKSISIVDLIFQIRQNPAKVSRLKTFLSWKDVRKNVKDSDDKAGGADDALDLEEGALPGANPAAPQKTQTNKKAKLILPWEVQSYFSEQVPEREDEEDEEEEEQNEATLARLASADERTKNMTREEYVYWSECRQASFTFRKGKRFREWAGFGTIIDSKPNDDVVDILGFLTFEIVQTLTEEALRVKNAEDLANKKAGRGDVEASKKRKREGCTLFEMPREERTPVEPKHVQEAFRRLQIVPNKYKFMRQGLAGTRTPLRMI